MRGWGKREREKAKKKDDLEDKKEQGFIEKK
jgi:hypothetical protein